MTDPSLKPVDHTAIKVSQTAVILLNIAAFVLHVPWLAAVVAGFMLGGALLGKPGFGFLYTYLLKPLNLARPDILPDHPEPHRFAQGLGGFVMLAGSIALFAGAAALGWALVWMVAALAALNAYGGFCVGCFIYYWLARLHVPGFVQSPPPGTFPGVRPHHSKN